MGRGLPVRGFRIFAGGGIDTKTDPRLEPAGNLIEVENMYYLKTGELRLRNGFVKLAATRSVGSLDNLFATPQGGLMAVTRSWLGISSIAWPMAVKYGTAPTTGWEVSQPARFPYPLHRAQVDGIAAASTVDPTAVTDLFDPDLCTAGGLLLSAWSDGGSVNGGAYLCTELATGKRITSGLLASIVTGRAAVCAAGGTRYACSFWTNGAVLSAVVIDSTTGTTVNYAPAGANLVFAQPWLDAKPIPGGNNIALAWRDSAGGVTCAIFNPASGTLSSIVNTAAVDATMCLGFLDDSLATGNMYLATAGATDGVRVRTMLATTMVVSATDSIDPTATANVRNVTGHITTGPTVYKVLWDISNATTYLDRVRICVVNGASHGVSDLAPSFSLYSKTTKLVDGKYYFLGAYDSAVQPCYSLLGTEFYDASTGILPDPVSQCQVMPNNGGGRRAGQSSLTSSFSIGTSAVMAVARKLKVATPGSPVAQGRAVQRVTFSPSPTLMRPRELGGTLFLPGGLVMKDDGLITSWATCPFYPEAFSGASSATGGMTASGAYSYRGVYRRTDIGGRITRSASSVPFAITLGAGDGRVTLTAQNPRLQPMQGEDFAVEIYRAGPAAAGATQYNKVGEVSANAVTGGNTLSFVDTMSDANAAFGELLYSTGNVLESFVTPSCNLLEVNGNRAGIVNSEDTSEFWPSLEYKDGQGLRFNPLMAIRVTGDGYGGITALAAMDGRWILFKKAAVYVISGAGPNDLGQGSFAAPQAVSLSIGTVLPGSVIATPDGIMFQAAAGIYLLDRGLGLTYIGAPVEQYTLAENAVDAALVSGVTQVRFVMPSGRCLAWDYQQKKWTTFALRVDTNGVASTVVACANSAQFGWCYALADGSVMKETPGVYSDINVTTTAIVPRIGFPHLALAGINGFQRVYAVEVLGQYVGDHTLAVDFEYDYSGGITETRTLAITAGSYQYEIKPAQQKGGALKLTLRASAIAAGSGAFRLSGLTLWAGMKAGSNVPYTKRLT